jgi:UDP-N-acetyl-2-amino-2-deoxyglucuronate dehydrogenase
MEKEKLGVAIHGAGWVASAHAESWRRNPNCRIVSVGSRRRETAEKFVERLGLDCEVHDRFEDLLQDPRVDIVNISGPNQVHTPQGVAAAEAGKHLLMEKPMALSMKENRLLRDAVVGSGVKSVVSFVARWNPLVQNLRSLLRAQALGKLFYVEVNYWHEIGPWWHGFEWGRTREYGRSAMLLAGCHAVDLLRWLSGDEVVEVSAVSNNERGLFEFDPNVAAIVRFSNGAIGYTSCLYDGELPYQFNIDLVGTAGALRDNRLWSKQLLPGQSSWTTLGSAMLDSGDVQHHPFDAEIDHFVDSVLSDKDSDCSIADAYRTHELCMAIDRSIETGGGPVRLPLEGD